MSALRRLIVLAVAISMMGCAKTPPSAEGQRSAEQSVGVLFEVDGIRVYRFGDLGRYHYFAVPHSGTASTFSTWTESCGKNCVTTLTDEIQTVQR